jgi:hypothetical protein
MDNIRNYASHGFNNYLFLACIYIASIIVIIMELW